MSTIKKSLIKALAAISLAAMIFTQSGCWDRREIDQLGIITAIGVEPASGQRVKVILQNINPSATSKGAGGGGGIPAGGANKAYRNRSAEGDTMMDAIREMSRESPRRLFFAHNRIILISEELARTRGIQHIVDFFERNPEIRRTNWLLVAKDDIITLLDEPGRLDPTPSQRIFGIIQQRETISTLSVKRLGEFLETLESQSTQPFTAILEHKVNPATSLEHPKGIGQGSIPEPRHILKITGTALFRRDKMVGALNVTEGRGLMWARGEVQGGIIDIPAPDKNGVVSLEILHSKADLNPEIKNGQIFMNINIKLDSNLVETTVPLAVEKPATIKELQKLQNEVVQREIEAALTKVQQEHGLDAFGFGEAVHRKYPDRWKEMKNTWSDFYPGVQVRVQIDSKIRRTGLVSKPLVPKQN